MHEKKQHNFYYYLPISLVLIFCLYNQVKLIYAFLFTKFVVIFGIKSKYSLYILAYEQDFSKHAPNEIVPKIRMLWNSIPSQLAKENKKFIYGLIREGARAREYESAIMWLSDCGLVHKVCRVNAVGISLNDRGSCEIDFVIDTGEQIVPVIHKWHQQNKKAANLIPRVT